MPPDVARHSVPPPWVPPLRFPSRRRAEAQPIAGRFGKAASTSLGLAHGGPMPGERFWMKKPALLVRQVQRTVEVIGSSHLLGGHGAGRRK